MGLALYINRTGSSASDKYNIDLTTFIVPFIKLLPFHNVIYFTSSSLKQCNLQLDYTCKHFWVMKKKKKKRKEEYMSSPDKPTTLLVFPSLSA